VEHHALDRHRVRRIEHLEQVPRDGLALAILISCEVELGGVLHQPLQVADAVTLVGADHVEGLEVVVDLDAEDLPLLLVCLGDVGRTGRKVADVAHRCLDDDVAIERVGLVEKALDGLRLGGRLDDDEGGGHCRQVVSIDGGLSNGRILAGPAGPGSRPAVAAPRRTTPKAAIVSAG
jgi:hypothetical protein